VAHDRFERVWPAPDPIDPLPSRPDPFESPVDPVALPSGVFAPADAGTGRPFAPTSAVASSALAALNPGRRAVKALAAVGLAVVVVAAFIAWRSQPRAEIVTTAPSSPVATATNSPTATLGAPPTVSASVPASGPSSAMIVVAVTGRVRHPGLVNLPPGSRVADAIAAAGGALPKTDLSFVNLARKVTDGELIVIGVQPSPGMSVDQTGDPASSTAGATTGPVDINTAGLAQLETLSGIGPALAQRILDYRSQHGSFRSIDELQDVSGIGPAKFAEIQAEVTV
jgi:competence protein ComEA